MKIHQRILTHYLSCTSPVDKEGYLYKKRDRKSTFLRRWFVLKGNLLFYQERPADRSLLGVVVLEGCAVHAGDSDCSFSLVFTGPGLRTYHLAATDQPSQKSWITALLSASHVYISLLLRDLSHLYQEAKESRSCEGSSRPCTPSEPLVKASSSGSIMASVYSGSSHFNQHPVPTCRESRSHSASCVPHAHHHTGSAPSKTPHKRSPKHWSKRSAHVTPINGPAPLCSEWPQVDFNPLDDFVKLHEYYGNQVKQLRADWLQKKREEAEPDEEDLIDLS